MHEEIDYAEMLEIPVSTVNFVKKPSRRKKNRPESTSFQTLPAPSFQNENFTQNPLRDSVIAQVNDRLSEEQTNSLFPNDSQENFSSSPAFFILFSG